MQMLLVPSADGLSADHTTNDSKYRVKNRQTEYQRRDHYDDHRRRLYRPHDRERCDRKPQKL